MTGPRHKSVRPTSADRRPNRRTFNRSLLILGLAGYLIGRSNDASAEDRRPLPRPERDGRATVFQALARRRTRRSFGPAPLTLDQIGSLLWAANGLTGPPGDDRYRSAPSAGALHPLTIHLVAGRKGVVGLPPAVYAYLPEDHALSAGATGDRREAVARACLDQLWVARAPAMIAITGKYRIETSKYGRRGGRYTHIEAGCVCQNIFLAVEGLGLRAGVVGAFDDARLAATLGLPVDRDPILIMPLGGRE